MKLRNIAALGFGLSLGMHAYADDIHSPTPSGFAYSGQQILDRLQVDLAHPARYTGMFTGPTHAGRVASVTHCRRNGPSATAAFYTCDLVGVPVGTTANIQMSIFHSKVMSVMLSVENNNPKYADTSAVAAMLLEGAVVQATDPLALKTGLSNRTHENLIMDELSAGPSLDLRKDARDDGLTFEQRIIAGDLVLDVHPTGGA
ncbi:hypothetical protein HFU84_05870 [Acidithiobacillus sp. CV18-2]|uniref:Uncharacterized protein n=1 Tax=Igneacidithiobacillus copahuensis TaxID=2724909 RepID=A0AAE2YNX2_9PROT|nr:hypothetical protein [Igneacidithiobacillus copahuensis]MBU2754325.1 hypothetical protein [Acidithiobacillus sp. CV18-3]MBU2757652.1 hypothetical protein [Acidithiobacillus sp. BN09-2]MBU2777033.1 hypothetical protein [Acidithiobacillus sp. CV18-2]MBU2797337.1 hypothetical protein [Acidithiobacillus sp. VAN18-2]MBU2799816.1 hypothetical protein [Acidithiobacillus sp. VAN18-4]UTV81982.1 hypothetical protein MQE22_04980 [Acidithiobacillus sp. YTS05]